MKYILDTNVISEAINKQPNQQVMNWLRGMDTQELYLSVEPVGWTLPTSKPQSGQQIHPIETRSLLTIDV